MLEAGKWLMGIVGGGLLLGAFLGKAADPDMKDPPAPWWQLTDRDEVIVADSRQWIEVGPQDLAPTGYRPDLDYSTEVWALPIPEYELAALSATAFEPSADQWPLTADTSAGALSAADEAAEAVQDAEAAAEPAGEAPAPQDEVRRSDLALAGLY